MLTKGESEVLSYIVAYQVESGGVSPSVAEIGRATAIKSKSCVHRVLLRLESTHYIRRMKNRSRAIQVLRTTAPRYAAFIFDDEIKELRPHHEHYRRSGITQTRT